MSDQPKTSTEKTHNHFLDALVELVGQEKAKRAVELADRARAHTAALLREITEAVDPAADQRAALEEAQDEIARLNTQLDDRVVKCEQEKYELELTLGRRTTEINRLNAALEAELAKAPKAPKGKPTANRDAELSGLPGAG